MDARDMAASMLDDEYTVQHGDTFSDIARGLHVPVTKIMELNPDVHPKRLQVGQTIKVPFPFDRNMLPVKDFPPSSGEVGPPFAWGGGGYGTMSGEAPAEGKASAPPADNDYLSAIGRGAVKGIGDILPVALGGLAGPAQQSMETVYNYLGLNPAVNDPELITEEVARIGTSLLTPGAGKGAAGLARRLLGEGRAASRLAGAARDAEAFNPVQHARMLESGMPQQLAKVEGGYGNVPQGVQPFDNPESVLTLGTEPTSSLTNDLRAIHRDALASTPPEPSRPVNVLGPEALIKRREFYRASRNIRRNAARTSDAPRDPDTGKFLSGDALAKRREFYKKGGRRPFVLPKILDDTMDAQGLARRLFNGQ